MLLILRCRLCMSSIIVVSVACLPNYIVWILLLNQPTVMFFSLLNQLLWYCLTLPQIHLVILCARTIPHQSLPFLIKVSYFQLLKCEAAVAVWGWVWLTWSSIRADRQFWILSGFRERNCRRPVIPAVVGNGNSRSPLPQSVKLLPSYGGYDSFGTWSSMSPTLVSYKKWATASLTGSGTQLKTDGGRWSLGSFCQLTYCRAGSKVRLRG